MTEAEVRRIKGLLRDMVSRKGIAEGFGVSVYAVKEIALDYSWHHVD